MRDKNKETNRKAGKHAQKLDIKADRQILAGKEEGASKSEQITLHCIIEFSVSGQGQNVTKFKIYYYKSDILIYKLRF